MIFLWEAFVPVFFFYFFENLNNFRPKNTPKNFSPAAGFLIFSLKKTKKISAAGEKNDDLWLYLEILLRKNEGFLWDLWKYQVFLSGNLQNLKISYASSLKSPKSRNILCFFQVRRHKIVYPKPKQSENCLGYSLKKINTDDSCFIMIIEPQNSVFEPRKSREWVALDA